MIIKAVLIEEIKKWIQDKVEEQDGKAAHEDPAFSSEDVPLQAKSLEKLVMKLSKKPKPKPAKKEETKAEEDDDDEEDEELSDSSDDEEGKSGGKEGGLGIGQWSCRTCHESVPLLV